MTGIEVFQNRDIYYYFFFIIAAVPAAVWFFARSVNDAGKFWKGNKPERRKFLRRSLLRMILTLTTLITALALTVFAMMRPSWEQEIKKVEQKGRDVVFVVDVSKSMDAEDIFPSRLERAKAEIINAITVFQGDRVALVAAAGTSVLKCPLTLDYGFFRMAVEELDTRSVALGGSILGESLTYTVDKVFDNQSRARRDIILITDGEDLGSEPLEAARYAGSKDIRLIIIGLGDDRTGSRIPVGNEGGEKTYLEYEGEEVYSKLNSGLLREMASVSGDGRYLNVSTGSFDLKEIYGYLMTGEDQELTGESEIIIHKEKFQYFLLPALILVFIALTGFPFFIFGGGRKR